MTITLNSIAANTTQIEIRDELTATAMITAITNLMVAGGWELYDTKDVTEFSPMITKVYRVINKDAVTYKYLIVDFDTIHWEIRTFSCESWNLTTHAPLNRTWNAGGCFPQYYDLKSSEIIINVTPQHAVIWPFYDAKPDMWSGVFEFERIDPATTTPCFAWTNSELLGQDNYYNVDFVFPRTVLGQVGPSTADVYQPIMSRGNVPQGLGACCLKTYQWQNDKTLVSAISTDCINYSAPFGLMFDCGVTGNIGVALDVTEVKSDLVHKTPLETGTLLEYFLLPLNGGNIYNGGYAVGQQTVESTTPVVATAAHVAVGNKVFIANQNGVQRVLSLGFAEPFVTIYTDVNGTYDLAFDGKETIYAPTTDGVIAINVYSEVVTSLTLGDGGKYVAIDNKNIYVTGRTLSQTPKVYIIDRATFTVTATHTSTATPATTLYTRPETDYKGSCYAGVRHPQILYNAAYKMSKIDQTGEAVVSVGVFNTMPASGSNYRTVSWFYEYVSGTMYLSISQGNANATYPTGVFKVNQTTLAVTTTGATNNTSPSVETDVYGSAAYTASAPHLVPFKGFLISATENHYMAMSMNQGGVFSIDTVPSGTAATVNNISAGISIAVKPFALGARPALKGSVVFTSSKAAAAHRTVKVSNLHPISTNRLGATCGRLLVKS